MTKSLLCAIAAASIAVFAFTSSPVLAKSAKDCEAEWKAGKTDIQKSGKKKTDFMSGCRAEPAAAKADTKADTKAAATKTDKAAEAAQKKAQAAADKADKKAKADADKKAKADAKADAKTAAAAKKAEPKAAAVKPAPAAAAKPAAPAKPAVAAVEGKPGTVAMVARERACGADWKVDKAAGKTGSLTWPKYWSECNTRKKTQGM